MKQSRFYICSNSKFGKSNNLKCRLVVNSHDRTSSFLRIFIPTFSFEENVGIADFSNFCDMHFRNDKNFAEKQSETADLGKRKWKKSNGILAGKIFGEIDDGIRRERKNAG